MSDIPAVLCCPFLTPLPVPADMPRMFDTAGPACKRSDCALYVPESEACALLVIARSLSTKD